MKTTTDGRYGNGNGVPVTSQGDMGQGGAVDAGRDGAKMGHPGTPPPGRQK